MKDPFRKLLLGLLVVFFGCVFYNTVAFVRLAIQVSARPFVVRNDGQKPIHVLAVGTTSNSIVPLWLSSSPKFQKSIAPGSQDTFRYASDGVNLCWLLVVVDGEKPRVLKTPLALKGSFCLADPPFKERPYCIPIDSDASLVVPPTSELEVAPEFLVELAHQR